MKIKDILNRERPALSFEVFPPKKESSYQTVERAVHEIAELKPAFMSVTYGAGGGTSRYTVDIASNLMQKYGVTAMVHLTCVSSGRDQIRILTDQIKAEGIENILALRGDIPEVPGKDYRYASELIRELKAAGDFCIGGACYPEGHPESPDRREDLRRLKEKVDAGCDFLTTQMFFDNDLFYYFLSEARKMGITVPILAGVMPLTNIRQLKRTLSLSGTHLPVRLQRMADRFGDRPEAMKQAGIAYATEQIIDLLANGVHAVHIYTMNHPDVAAQIKRNLSGLAD
ncbi:MAG TPA: methylenetetrahydrofolate reductase [NAD(P)H] [Candidatus Eisenbergiella pullistercoris]|uniref:Methylenetetrahydrofolate reductase n=1 Tax=Candidatus Eisenbergiella pullistercoris TaxID=2838555 RepID=A0A9D1YSU1_9FIRM|nr:methylenetetrahydrofolate reductase [NAD(P)H] [Candidatus Eisenbergiella pullistercoris]